ncbi:NRDE family protein [Thalassotalea fusca]
MCILFIAIEQHSKYPLIVCANRDEFYDRPTLPMHEWSHSGILAGKDLKANGTWFGVNNVGNISALTNLRVPALYRDNLQSRGSLVLDALSHHTLNETPDQTISQLALQAEHYNPFNLIFERNNSLFCFNSVSKHAARLQAGFHSVCNGNIDDTWPKMAKGNQQLEQTLRLNKQVSEAKLFELLRDDQKAPESCLPSTGVDFEVESELSSIFVQMPQYGTRSSTIFLRENNGNSRIIERLFNEKGEQCAEQTFLLIDGQFKKHYPY